MGSELLQFAGMVLVFAVVGLAWLRIIYLPARTMEHWEGERPGARKERVLPSGAPGGARPREEDPDRP